METSASSVGARANTHVDDLDRTILACLTTTPRASFRRIALVAGVSEQTVARRYRALCDARLVHVTAVLDTQTVGETSWLVRIRCRPEGVRPVAQALARRPDVGWVFVAGGGTEVICAVRSTDPTEREDLLLARLPASQRVLSVSTALTLHRFAGGPSAGGAELGVALTPVQRALLQEPTTDEPFPPSPRRPLDASDHLLVDQLVRDGRSSVAQLATAAGLSAGAAARRLQTLLESGAVEIDVDIAPHVRGRRLQAQIWMSVTPACIQRCGEELAQMPEVAFAAAVTGSQNLVASVVCHDHADLYRFVSTRLGTLDGLGTVDVVPAVSTVKQATSLVDHDVLARRPLHP